MEIIDISESAEAQNWLVLGRLRETKGKTPAQIKKDQAEADRILAEEGEGELLSTEQLVELMSGSMR